MVARCQAGPQGPLPRGTATGCTRTAVRLLAARPGTGGAAPHRQPWPTVARRQHRRHGRWTYAQRVHGQFADRGGNRVQSIGRRFDHASGGRGDDPRRPAATRPERTDDSQQLSGDGSGPPAPGRAADRTGCAESPCRADRGHARRSRRCRSPAATLRPACARVGQPRSDPAPLATAGRRITRSDAGDGSVRQSWPRRRSVSTASSGYTRPSSTSPATSC